MSYIANLVNRTLGITPVAQPVIQAKFAPSSQTIAAAGRDIAATQSTAAAPGATQSLLKVQTDQIGKQQRIIDAQPEPAGAREGQRIVIAHVLNPVETAAAHSPSDERELVARAPENLRVAPHAAPDSPVAPQTRESHDWTSRAAQASDDFRLMKTAPSAQPTSGFRPASSTQGPEPFRFRETESRERPIVRVHIGRVDVRMVTPGAKEPSATMAAVPEARPASLDDYLRARQRGTR